MKRRSYLTVLTGLLLAAGTLNAQDLVILHTNDTHSQIEVMRTGPGAGKGGVHRRAEYIDRIRKSHKNVLLLDAGDYNQGTPYFTVFRGDLEIQLMNSLGYDAVALGNHEFDNGLEELARRLSAARFKTVCANYDFSRTPIAEYVEPYVIVKKAGRKIGIIGLTTELSHLVARQNIKGMVYRDPVKVTNRLADLLKNRKGCDLVIVLSHLGYSAHPDRDSDIKLAKESRNVDIIVGGHTHTFLKTEKLYRNRQGKDVIVVQVGCKGEYVGRFDIDFR